jgi:superfamily II DNA or RNA helicase
MLKSYDFKAVYSSENDNLLEDFYVPALSRSVYYDRAVGFFSAAILSYAAQGLTSFIKNDGKMRLIIGYELTFEEIESIKDGYEDRKLSERIGRDFIKTIEEVEDHLFTNRLEALSWMVAGGSLDIKVALRMKGNYHDKVGIFKDQAGNSIVFEGSANETANALLPDFNFESVTLFPSWKPELTDYYQPYFDGFTRLWDNKSKSTVVVEFPEAAKEKLIKIAKSIRIPPDPELEKKLASYFEPVKLENENIISEPKIPEYFGSSRYELRKHQRNTIQSWTNDGYHGIFALATGAGKTITAIHAAVRTYEAIKKKNGKLCLVISVPYINLGDQWVDNLRLFQIDPIGCYGSSDRWTRRLSEAIDSFNAGVRDFLCIVVVNATLRGAKFQTFLERFNGKDIFFVGDECHHHSSKSLANALPPNAEYRIGLSATPEHYIDDEATARISNYYGRIVSNYDLKMALNDGILSPYKYFIEPIELTPDETEKYVSFSQDISAIYAQMSSGSNISKASQDKLEYLLRERARLVGAAQNKLVALESILEGMAPEPLTLFYCGDGSVEDEADSTEFTRQIEAVTQLLNKANWKTSRFTARESKKARQNILNNFKVAVIDAMVAIRCLDEGIDVPACRTAFILASSRNPRQFIQRRGRILRRSEGKEYAVIYDFLVKLPEDAIHEGYEQKLVVAEVERVAEFASLSLNSSDAYRALQPILEKYDLEHLVV